MNNEIYFYLEYNSTIKCSWTGKSISSLAGVPTIFPVLFSKSDSSQVGTGLPFSVASIISLNIAPFSLASFTFITSFTFVK